VPSPSEIDFESNLTSALKVLDGAFVGFGLVATFESAEVSALPCFGVFLT
jgi:hypothetical protein